MFYTYTGFRLFIKYRKIRLNSCWKRGAKVSINWVKNNKKNKLEFYQQQSVKNSTI